MSKKSLIIENILKNIFVIFLAVLFYPLIIEPIKAIGVDQMNDFLLIISIFLVSVCFANFAFTYEKSNFESKVERFFSHITVIFFLLSLLISLLGLVTAIGIVYPTLKLTFSFLTFLLYTGIVFYDFWDLFRVKVK